MTFETMRTIAVASLTVNVATITGIIILRFNYHNLLMKYKDSIVDNVKLKCRLVTNLMEKITLASEKSGDSTDVFNSYVVIGKDNKAIAYLDESLGEKLQDSVQYHKDRGFKVVPLTGFII